MDFFFYWVCLVLNEKGILKRGREKVEIFAIWKLKDVLRRGRLSSGMCRDI